MGINNLGNNGWSARDLAEWDSRNAKTPGAQHWNAHGGAHSQVQQYSRRGISESNHVPPNDTYGNSPYQGIPVRDRSAHQMNYDDHRNHTGGIGAASSTGSSDESRRYRADVVGAHMRNGNLAAAFDADANDIRNTTAPNRGYYTPSLTEAAYHNYQTGRISAQEYHQTLQNLHRD